MNIILVLSANSSHFRHYERDIITDKDTKLINVQEEEHLYGLKPVAIIMLHEWWFGKSESFQHRVEVLCQRIKQSTAD